MLKRMIIMLLLVGIVLGGIFGFKMFGNKMMAQYLEQVKNPVQTVSTMKAEKKTWDPSVKAVGTFHAIQGTDIASEASGMISKIHFQSGQMVEKGAILIELNSKTDSARLRSLEAAENLARLTYERNKKQFEAQAISQAQLDQDASALASARAAVEEQRAVLDKKIIRAPFSGRLGIKNVDLGQFLNVGTKIVSLQKIDELNLNFYIPQRSIALLEKGQKIVAKIDALKDQDFEGTISAIDTEVDEDTRNILVQATIKNKDEKLIPGMFATAYISMGSSESFITLPQTTISYNPYGDTVFLVENSKNEKGESVQTVKQIFVKTGERRGDQIAVISGLKEGEEIVTSGQLKLRNGTQININNNIAPLNEENPQPIDE